MVNTFLIPNKIYMWRNPPWCFNNYCTASSWAPPLLNMLPAWRDTHSEILEINEMWSAPGPGSFTKYEVYDRSSWPPGCDSTNKLASFPMGFEEVFSYHLAPLPRVTPTLMSPGKWIRDHLTGSQAPIFPSYTTTHSS